MGSQFGLMSQQMYHTEPPGALKHAAVFPALNMCSYPQSTSFHA